MLPARGAGYSIGTSTRQARANMPAVSLDLEMRGEGPDLVLLHSLLADRASFASLAERLAGERRLILVNMPGFGASPPAEPLAGYADRIIALFDELSLPPADVIGNGLGGFVALAMAARHGERLRRIVAIGSAASFTEPGRATFRALADKAERDGMAALADAAVRRMFTDSFIAGHPEIAAERAAAFRAMEPGVFAKAARALAALDLSADLPRIRNPVLVVAGERDGATPPGLGRDLAARLPEARFVELPGLGHAPHVEAPDAVVAAVSPFLGLRPS
jgi:3-oxoadipate enol-lactonase